MAVIFHAEQVFYGTEFVFSLIVLPIAFFSLIVLGFRSFRQKSLVDALPLLASQANTLFIYSCLCCSLVGHYWLEISFH